MKKTPVVAPPSIRVELLTPEVKAYAQALDELIHEHREKPIQPYGFSKEIRPLGALQWGFPAPNVRERPEKEIKRLPYSEIWLAWRDAQMKKAGADKGFWCLRAAACQAISGWGTNAHKEWAKKNVERQRLDQVLSQSEISGLQYPAIVRHLLRWFLFLHPADQNADLLLDAATMFASLVPAESFHDTLPQVEPQPKPSYYYYGAYQHDERAPWRGDSGPIRACLRLLGDLGSPLSKPQAERRWRLQRWLDEPTEGATRSRPSNADLIAAYRQGVANFDDFADALLGPRARRNSYSYLSDFGLFRELTARRPSPECRQLLADHPEVRSLVEQAIDKIADTELTRGETPTAATDPAQDIGAIYGTARLIQFLAAIGKSGFKISSGWRSEASLQRITTLTHLASVTYPRQEDSPEQFANLMRAEIEEKNFPEDRLIELAFLAPQWSKYVQHYFGWKGMAEALYWYLAHMNFMWGATTGENAAESAGLAELKKPEETAAAESADTESADIGDEEGAKAPKVEILTPWEQLVRERTSLTRAERDDGAIDVNWFHRVYKEIGPKRWERLAKAAKFAANAAQAKKASLIASVLLGEADLKELIAGIEKRYLKDNVRLLGLFPLPKGGKRDAELAIRHKVLTEYGRYAKQLSGLTKPAALRALEIGLKNLASTAGFEDALRLDWALGASQWADLAKGPVKVSKEGAEVMLAIDEQAAPIVTVTRNGKELKTAPAAVKKDPKVALLYERAKELRRQSSRQKQSLEAAMLRGDEFSAGELVQLCEHALVAPFLTRLVLVGDGVMGYPDKGGRALRDHAGKLEPVKKGETLRIAHPHDLFASGDWAQWQRDCFAMERVQPFKQVFRELYLATSQEKADGYQSHRYAGQQVQPRQAAALLGARAWNTGEGVFKVFHREDIVAWLLTNSGVTTPLEVEGWTIESVHFAKRGQSKPISMADVPARIFSEVMRDVDLVVSVAHRGGVDPEASASTVEMRASLLRETCQLLGLTNVRVQEQYAFIDGFHANYSLHLGSGSIHRLPGGYLCVVPVHSQHRGRLFLPFADDDPRTAEVISKLLLLARDQEISDPSILDQLRAF